MRTFLRGREIRRGSRRQGRRELLPLVLPLVLPLMLRSSRIDLVRRTIRIGVASPRRELLLLLLWRISRRRTRRVLDSSRGPLWLQLWGGVIRLQRHEGRLWRGSKRGDGIQRSHLLHCSCVRNDAQALGSLECPGRSIHQSKEESDRGKRQRGEGGKGGREETYSHLHPDCQCAAQDPPDNTDISRWVHLVATRARRRNDSSDWRSWGSCWRPSGDFDNDSLGSINSGKAQDNIC
jgi:hypothetical protein